MEADKRSKTGLHNKTEAQIHASMLFPNNQIRTDVYFLQFSLSTADIVVFSQIIIQQCQYPFLDVTAFLVHGIAQRIYQIGYRSKMFFHLSSNRYFPIYCKQFFFIIRHILEIDDFLLENGADINLFGNGGIPPIVAAYYTHTPELVEYLLQKGANPNVNCYKDDPIEKDYCCTILSCINELLNEEYDDKTKEIERIVKQYGGRLYPFRYNRVK